VIVIAGGAGYIIDPDTGQQVHEFGGNILFVQHVSDLNIVIIGDNVRLGAFSTNGWWSTDRISWDGMRNIALEGTTLHGEAWSPISEGWHPFEVDLLTGSTRGAIYSQEMATAVRITPS
jgi:hypothetical protein